MPVLFEQIPNFVREKLSWKTNVRSTRNGEWRDSLRDATQLLTLGFRSVGTDPNAIRARYRANTASDFYVPLYMDMSKLDATLPIGSTSVAVGVGDYVVGGKAVVIRSGASEILDVSGWDGTTLTFTATTTEHTAGSIIAPLATCIIPQGVESSLSYVVDDLSLTFLRTDNTDLGGSAYAQLEGLPILSDPSVVVSPLEGGVRRSMELIDSAFGSYSLIDKETYTRERASLQFVDKDRATRWARKQFLHFLRGRDGAFWLPSWRRDLVLSEAATSGALNVIFNAFGTPEDHATLVGEYLDFADGTAVTRREITATAELSGNRVSYDLASSLGANIGVAGRVSVLRKVRMDNDEIELDHAFAGGSDFITSLTANVVEVVE